MMPAAKGEKQLPEEMIATWHITMVRTTQPNNRVCVYIVVSSPSKYLPPFIIAFLLFAYLLVAMLYPEKF